MLYREIIGQPEVKRKLLHLVQGERVPHAMLLFGPAGTGKLALAVATAQYLSCLDRHPEDACGSCTSCVKFARLVHPDLHFVVPVLKTGSVTKDPVTSLFMEEWREVFLSNWYLSDNQWYEAIGAENKQGVINTEESQQLISRLGYKPYESDYRMVVIWLPEKMNQAAANKLLKLVEEPPENTVILMASEDTGRILPTILSRTQLLHVPPLAPGMIREGLLDQGAEEGQLLEDAVRKSNGDYNMALRTLREDEQEQYYFELFTGLMRLCYKRDILRINDWVEQVSGIGRERQKQLIEHSLRLLRESFVLHQGEEALTYMSQREKEFAEKFSRFIHGDNIEGLVRSFSEAGNHIEANGNSRIVLMDMAIQVIRLLLQKAPEEV